MRKVSLSEFKHMACLSDRALVWLIERNHVELIPGDESPSIDIESVQIQNLIKALSSRSQELCYTHGSWIEEKVASICMTKIEEILESALTQAETLG